MIQGVKRKYTDALNFESSTQNRNELNTFISSCLFKLEQQLYYAAKYTVAASESYCSMLKRLAAALKKIHRILLLPKRAPNLKFKSLVPRELNFSFGASCWQKQNIR